MNAIFDLIDEDKKVSYDKEYIENLYVRYMDTGRVHEEHKSELIERLAGKIVLLIAAGTSSVDEKDRIVAFACRKDVITISVNYNYAYANTDFIFLSNLRRYRELEPSAREKCIATSNIPADGVYLQTKYRDLLTDVEAVRDNACLMATKFLAMLGVKQIYLAGLDGYTHDNRQNYGDKSMSVAMKNAVLDAINEGIKQVLWIYRKTLDIKFLTTPKLIDITN